MYNLEGKSLTQAIKELSEQNDALALTVQRTRLSVKRLRLEYGVLLERLESRIDMDPTLHYDEPLPSLESFKLNLLESIPNSKARKRKLKEKRDPNLPKRPTNAYLLFCEMNKEKIKEQLGSNNADITKTLPEMWKHMDEDAKKPYYNLYNEDRLRYQREMSAYSQKHNTDVKHEHDNEEDDIDLDDSDVTQPDNNLIIDGASEL